MEYIFQHSSSSCACTSGLYLCVHYIYVYIQNFTVEILCACVRGIQFSINLVGNECLGRSVITYKVYTSLDVSCPLCVLLILSHDDCAFRITEEWDA